MTYLIALIIAIALGAVIALLSFVNIGSGFGNQSAAAKAQQFSQAGSQLEVAMAAYRADNAGTAFDTDLAGTFANLENDDSGDNWLKEAPVKPTGTGTLSLQQDGTDVYLTLDGVSSQICDEINNLGGQSPASLGSAPQLSDVAGNRLICVTDSTDTLASFKVE